MYNASTAHGLPGRHGEGILSRSILAFSMPAWFQTWVSCGAAGWSQHSRYNAHVSGNHVKFDIEERPSASSFVEAIWRAHSESTGTFLSQAASHWEIVVTRHAGQTTITVRWPETRATTIDVGWTEGEFVGIVFRLGTFMPCLPPGQVMDHRDATLPLATRSSFLFGGSTWPVPDFENADDFVVRLVRAGLLVRDPVVEAVLEGHQHHWSPRSVQHHFVHATGLSHTTIRQIERVRRAASLLEEGRSIADVLGQTGYYDQPHLTRSLKRFMGQTPAHMLRGLLLE